LKELVTGDGPREWTSRSDAACGSSPGLATSVVVYFLLHFGKNLGFLSLRDVAFQEFQYVGRITSFLVDICERLYDTSASSIKT